MKMPASFAEFSDALQKARIKDGSFCKNELTCIHYNGLTHAMIGWNANLYDLNLFAQRLASLTEEQKKGMDALLKIKQNHRVAPIPLNQLINLTYNTDICCFAPRVSNHEELGAFLYANEMLSNEAKRRRRYARTRVSRHFYSCFFCWSWCFCGQYWLWRGSLAYLERNRQRELYAIHPVP